MKEDRVGKTRVLVFIDWYLPGYKAGGPIQSVINLVSQLKGTINFSIVTSDSDFGDADPYPGIQSDHWIKEDKQVQIQYLSKKNQSLRGLKQIIDPNEYDYIYLNSVFSYKFSILPLLAFNSSSAQIILAPRGMLGEGALEIKSLKKKIFISLARFTGLYDNVLWQATNAAESEDIINMFGEGAKVTVVSNIPSPVETQTPDREKSTGSLKLVFLSRISKKKNLLGLLEALKNMNVEGDIALDVYGPIEDDSYWLRCKEMIKTLPEKINVLYLGAIPQSQIKIILAKYHFFALLTRHENFGHAIFEALSVGCPLIISDTTPWRNLEQNAIGWDIALEDQEGFSKAISSCLQMGQSEYSKMSQQAHRYAHDYWKTNSAVEQSLNLFKD